MKKTIRLAAAGATLLCSALSAQSYAQLLNVVQNFPDTTVGSPAFIFYDHDGVNATTGLLRLVTYSSILNEGAAAGGTTATQLYSGTGDSVPDVVLSLQIRNGTGGFTAGSFVSGTVSVGFGNNTAANRWKWDGTVTALGSQIGGTGTILDATWNVTGGPISKFARRDESVRQRRAHRPVGRHQDSKCFSIGTLREFHKRLGIRFEPGAQHQSKRLPRGHDKSLPAEYGNHFGHFRLGGT